MGTKREFGLPLRRGSAVSEQDFFDIPEEPCLAIVKRQLRRTRAYIVLAIFLTLLLFLRRSSPRQQPSKLPHIDYDRVNWSLYAYSQYATSEPYLCNALMVFEALQRLGSRASRILFYPDEWDMLVDGEGDRRSQLLLMAKDQFNAHLIPIDLQMIQTGSGSTESWDMSTSKFLAFGETQYDRIIHLDSDVTVLQSMDELFFLPPAKVAMPRAYWNLPETNQLSSLLIVIEPSFREYTALMDATEPIVYGQVSYNSTAGHRYDMELLNERYADSALVLPHRQYGLITGEFRAANHQKFLGTADEVWDPDKVLAEAKLVHFADWPLPQPWVMWPQALLSDMLPKCKFKPGTAEESGCRDRELWKGLYDDFRKRRKDVCKLLSFPAPDWPPREHPGE